MKREKPVKREKPEEHKEPVAPEEHYAHTVPIGALGVCPH